MMQKSNADRRGTEALPLVKPLSHVVRREWLLPLLLLVLVLLPIWNTSICQIRQVLWSKSPSA